MLPLECLEEKRRKEKDHQIKLISKVRSRSRKMMIWIGGYRKMRIKVRVGSDNKKIGNNQIILNAILVYGY